MSTQAFNQGYTMDACIVMKALPDFSQIANSPYLEYEREMSSIRSHFDYEEDPVDSGLKATATEVYPDNPNSSVASVSKASNHNKSKSPLVWGEDITFLDRRQRENRSGEEAGTQYISLNGFSFFPKEEGTEDLNDICSSLELVDQSLVESHPCTVEEIYQSPLEATVVQGDPPVTGRAGLRRTRTASRRVSVVFSEDDNSFGSQTESVNKSSRKRHMSGQSVMSGGSYDDPDDSPYNNNSNGRKKRRRYEENPSEDPAFEKSRKNAIIAKRNREKKKALMDEMEKQCHKLTKDNNHLDSDNTKLRNRVKTLENEVFYLKSVLANDSALSTVFSGLKKVGNLQFSSNLDQFKPHQNSVTSSSSTTNQPKTGGICVHVDGQKKVSVEKCSDCTILVNKDACLDGSSISAVH